MGTSAAYGIWPVTLRWPSTRRCSGRGGWTGTKGECRIGRLDCQAIVPHNEASALRALDAAFDAAMSSGDIAALDALAADDFVYTHSGGESQARADFLQAQADRSVRSTRRFFDIRPEAHADFAL